MISWPVISKELKKEANSRHLPALRGGAAFLFFLILLTLKMSGRGPAAEAHTFLAVHCALFAVIWMVGPLLAADCLAFEKREGTLDLLLLTPLSFTGIAIAKSFVQILRGATLILAIVPIYCFLLFMGSVDGLSLATSLSVLVSSLMIALPLGSLVSALFVRRTSAQWAAVLSGGVLGLGCAATLGVGFVWTFKGLIPLDPPEGISFVDKMTEGLRLTLNIGENWGGISAQDKRLGLEGLWLAFHTVLWAGSFAAGLLIMMSAAQGLKWIWTSTSVRVERGSLIHLLPRLPRDLAKEKRLRRRLLRKNPISWLCSQRFHQRKSAWFLAVVVGMMESLLFSVFEVGGEGWFIGQLGLAAFWILILSLESAVGFRQEKQSGFLELLLVSPVSGWQLFSGKAVSIWKTYLPAFGIWIACLYGANPRTYLVDAVVFLGIYGAGVLLVTPWMGLDSAFNFRRFWSGWLATFGAVAVLPGLLFAVAWRMAEPWMYLSIAAIHAVTGLLCAFGLTLQLNERLLDRRPSKHRSRHRSRRRRKRYKKVYVRPIIDSSGGGKSR